MLDSGCVSVYPDVRVSGGMSSKLWSLEPPLSESVLLENEWL